MVSSALAIRHRHIFVRNRSGELHGVDVVISRAGLHPRWHAGSKLWCQPGLPKMIMFLPCLRAQQQHVPVETDCSSSMPRSSPLSVCLSFSFMMGIEPRASICSTTKLLPQPQSSYNKRKHSVGAGFQFRGLVHYWHGRKLGLCWLWAGLLSKMLFLFWTKPGSFFFTAMIHWVRWSTIWIALVMMITW